MRTANSSVHVDNLSLIYPHDIKSNVSNGRVRDTP